MVRTWASRFQRVAGCFCGMLVGLALSGVREIIKQPAQLVSAIARAGFQNGVRLFRYNNIADGLCAWIW